MIKELSEFGKNLRKKESEKEIVHNALKKEFVSIDIVIKEDGRFVNFISFEKKPTIVEAITAKKGKARLLLDKAEEVLSYGTKAEKKHQLFLEKLQQYKEIDELAPVLKFYCENKTIGLDKAVQEFEKSIDEKERKGNIAFRLENSDKRIHEESSVYERIIQNYENEQKELLANSEKICSICGKKDYPVYDIPHGMIKRVPAGQSSGCALVSYNENAFESYELKGNDNSSICVDCARTYVLGLNWLLSNGNPQKITTNTGKEKDIFKYKNRKNFGSDTTMVFWTRKNYEVKELGLLDEPDPAEVAGLIESVTKGQITNFEDDQFYSCTLSGTAARIAVRDWIETSLIDLQKSIAKWFKDIAIEYYDWDLVKIKRHFAMLYKLAASCQRKNSDGRFDKNDASLSRTSTYLWKSALKNIPLPMWILTNVLKRAQLDGVTPDRAALIKLILNRNNKGGDFMIEEKLSEQNVPTSYICGRIFALLENIQYAALGKTNAGIRERYFSYAMTTPSSAFGRLFNLSSKHFTKLKTEKPGLAVLLDKELQEICKDIQIQKFPAAFSLEEQGQFAIGYYHQKQASFNKKELKEINENIEEK